MNHPLSRRRSAGALVLGAVLVTTSSLATAQVTTLYTFEDRNPATQPIISFAEPPTVVTIPVAGSQNAILDVDFEIGGFEEGCGNNSGIVHTYIQDLTMTLQSPAGTTVVLFSAPFSSNQNFCGLIIDDQAAENLDGAPIVLNSPDFTDQGANPSRRWRPEGWPENQLASFNGQNPNGNWTLTVTDGFDLDDGVLQDVTLRITTPTAAQRAVFGAQTAALEGNTGDSNVMTFTVSLNAPNNFGTGDIVVGYDVIDGTAAAGVDYAATTGTVTFPNNGPSLTQTFDVPLIGNDVREANKTLDVQLSVVSGPGAGVPGGLTSNNKILNDDPLPLNFAFSANIFPPNDLGFIEFDPSFPGGPGLNYEPFFRTTADGRQLYRNGDFGPDGFDTFYTNERSAIPASPGVIATRNLVHVDANTRRETLVVPVTGFTTGREFITGMTFDYTNDTMYVMTTDSDGSGNFPQRLYSINVNSGVLSFIGNCLPDNINVAAGLVSNSDTGQLYVLNTAGGGAVERLYPINKATGAVGRAITVTGGDDLGTFTMDLDFNDFTGEAVVAGITEDFGNVARLYTLDLALGTLTTVDNATQEAAGLGQVSALGIVSTPDIVLSQIAVSNGTITEGDTGTQVLDFTVSLDSPNSTGSDIVLNYTTLDGTAKSAPATLVPNGDYDATSGQIIIPDGQAGPFTIPVTINGDELFEDNENFQVTITLDPTSATALIVDGFGTGTITDDDDTFEFLGVGTLNDAPTGPDAIVGVELLSGGLGVLFDNPNAPFVGGDFVGDDLSRFYTINQGTNQSFFVDPFAGTITPHVNVTGFPADQFVFDLAYNLVDGKMYCLTMQGNPFAASTLGTIDIDTGVFTTLASFEHVVTGVRLIFNIAADPNTGDIYAIALDPGFTGLFLHELSTSQNNTTTLIGNTNRISPNGVFFFPMNFDRQESVLYAFWIVDAGLELRTVDVATGNSTLIGGTVGSINQLRSLGVARVSDPNAAQAFVSDASIVEGDSGTTNAEFTVSLNVPNATGGNIIISYQTTSAGCAVQGTDYTAVSGNVVIPNGQQSATFSVPVIGDSIVESDEDFFVSINIGPGSATVIILDSAGRGTIVNDDIFGMARVGLVSNDTTGFFGRVNLDNGVGGGMVDDYAYIAEVGGVNGGDFIDNTGTTYVFAANQFEADTFTEQLFSLNPATGVITPGPAITGLPTEPNPTPGEDPLEYLIADLSWDQANNRMLALIIQTGLGLTQIGTIDTNTGAYTTLQTYEDAQVSGGVGGFSGMAVDNNGDVYVVGLNLDLDQNIVLQADLSTPDSMLFNGNMNIPANLFFFGPLADIQAGTGQMFASFTDFSTNTVSFYEVNKLNGAATLIGTNCGAGDVISFAVFPAGASVEDWSLISH